MRGRKGLQENKTKQKPKLTSRQLKREELCGQKQGSLGKGLSGLVWDS